MQERLDTDQIDGGQERNAGDEVVVGEYGGDESDATEYQKVTSRQPPPEPTSSNGLQLLPALIGQLDCKRRVAGIRDGFTALHRASDAAALFRWETSPLPVPLVVAKPHVSVPSG